MFCLEGFRPVNKQTKTGASLAYEAFLDQHAFLGA